MMNVCRIACLLPVALVGPARARRMGADRSGVAAPQAIGASWLGAYEPEYDVARGANDLARQAPAEAVTAMVSAFPDADLPRVAAAARTLPRGARGQALYFAGRANDVDGGVTSILSPVAGDRAAGRRE